jgi:hypothetical protein
MAATARPGFVLAQVPRPTETRAIRRATATAAAAPLPDLAALFEAVITAHHTGDRRGLSLVGHAIARIAGPARAGGAA